MPFNVRKHLVPKSKAYNQGHAERSPFPPLPCSVPEGITLLSSRYIRLLLLSKNIRSMYFLPSLKLKWHSVSTFCTFPVSPGRLSLHGTHRTCPGTPAEPGFFSRLHRAPQCGQAELTQSGSMGEHVHYFLLCTITGMCNEELYGVHVSEVFDKPCQRLAGIWAHFSPSRNV